MIFQGYNNLKIVNTSAFTWQYRKIVRCTRKKNNNKTFPLMAKCSVKPNFSGAKFSRKQEQDNQSSLPYNNFFHNIFEVIIIRFKNALNRDIHDTKREC